MTQAYIRFSNDSCPDIIWEFPVLTSARFSNLVETALYKAARENCSLVLVIGHKQVNVYCRKNGTISALLDGVILRSTTCDRVLYW